MRAERGDAVVEFIGLAIVIIIPVVYLILTCAAIQGGALAVSSGAREASRLLRTDSGDINLAEVAVKQLVADQQVEGTVKLAVDCPNRCLPGEVGRVTVSAAVSLPLLPKIVGEYLPTQIPVSASSPVIFRGGKQR